MPLWLVCASNFYSDYSPWYYPLFSSASGSNMRSLTVNHPTAHSLWPYCTSTPTMIEVCGCSIQDTSAPWTKVKNSCKKYTCILKLGVSFYIKIHFQELFVLK